MKWTMLLWTLTMGLTIAGCNTDENTDRILDEYTVDVTDVKRPTLSGSLTDDRIEDKQTTFDPDLFDSRPVDGWLVNQSAAVIKLDIKLVNPEDEAHLLTLHKSYKDAFDEERSAKMLPSVNMIDGKAKQFDDGLYAAIDQALYEGVEDHFTSHVQLVQDVFEKLKPDSAARPFLAAALSYADVKVTVVDKVQQQKWQSEFDGNQLRSKPIGFYNWNPTLQRCWKFMRFLQHPFTARELNVPSDIAALLASDEKLAADYVRAVQFYEKFTNPSINLSLADVQLAVPLTEAKVTEIAESKNRIGDIPFFPPSTSKETELFRQIFENSIPVDVNLMDELVKRIRSGEVDLKPRPDAGWYEHQVYALETLLLAEQGSERNKLLLTKAYKKRMLDAFKALITKRRETQGLAFRTAMVTQRELDIVSPRLRIEPNPTYYLRTARAYSFVHNVLLSALSKETLTDLHGLTASGKRSQNLQDELKQMQNLFYGLHLISAEDIGMQPEILTDETDFNAAKKVALQWLETAWEDPDLAMDTRVSIPIAYDMDRDATRIWATAGVRLCKLEAEFATGENVPPPSVRPVNGSAEWKEAEQLKSTHYFIPVDEFIEVELKGSRVLTRKEFRAICDKQKTKEDIVAALTDAKQ